MDGGHRRSFKVRIPSHQTGTHLCVRFIDRIIASAIHWKITLALIIVRRRRNEEMKFNSEFLFQPSLEDDFISPPLSLHHPFNHRPNRPKDDHRCSNKKDNDKNYECDVTQMKIIASVRSVQHVEWHQH